MFCVRYFLITIFISSFQLQETVCQDIIHKEDGSKVDAKILAIKDSSIVYMKWNDQDSILYETPKRLINSIRFAKVGEQKQKTSHYIPYSQNIKSGVTSLFQHTLQAGYERKFFSKFWVEATLHRHIHISFIDSELQDVDGWGVDFGIKYYPFAGNAKNDIKNMNYLSRFYLKGILHYTDRFQIDFGEIYEYTAILGGLQLGYTYSLSDRINLDLFTGVHFESGDATISPIDGRFVIPTRLTVDEGNFFGDENVVFSLGIKMGYFF